MREGWEIKSLGEIADVEYGFTDKSAEEGDYRYVRITDIDNNGELISTEKKYLKHSKEAERFLLQNNDLLMARTGATFAKVLLYEDIETSVFASYLIRIKFKEKIDNKLYWYFSKTKFYWDQANSLASGAAQPHFNGAAVKQVLFSYPKSPTEQQRIVALLDETFAVIAKAKANAEQNLKNAKELFDSYLHKYYISKEDGWEEKKLKEVAEYFNGLTYSPKDVSNEGIIVLRSSNVQSDVLDFNDIVRVNLRVKEKIIVKEGDILMCSRNGSARLVGKTATIKNLNEEMTFGTFMMIIRSQYNSYLSWFFKSADFKKQIKGGENTMINQITRYMLDDIVLSFPPIDRQHEIVKKLDALSAKIRNLDTLYDQKINDLEELKKSILQKAFSGELTAIKENVQIVTSKVIKLATISPTDLQAGITAIALQRHQQQNKTNTFHHVKAEKIVHLAQSILSIDLERNPVKDAAGPNDFPHAKKVESRAMKAGFYTVKKNGTFYEYNEGTQFQKLIDKTKNSLGEKSRELIKLIDLLVPMTTQQAEIFATVYAAWNNLLLEDKEITDEAIVFEARENWHKDKLKIERDKFFIAIKWMRKKNIIPAGNGKIVLPKSA